MYVISATCVFLIYFVIEIEGQCYKDGVEGVCINLANCPSAIEDIKNRRRPQICGFEGVDPIVCCPNSGPSPVATTSTIRTPTTTEYVPPVYDYQSNDQTPPSKCDPLLLNTTAPRTQQKAWNKCIEYQEQLVYPCVKGVALAGGLTRVSRCGHNADQLIVGGMNAAKNEFPHMVLLGFGDTAATAKWLCGGTLISDRFILTAGHCTSERDNGKVSFAILSALKRSDQVDSSQVYAIKNIIKHPLYKPPAKYNDIALLETATTIKLDQFAVPACLDVGDASSDYEKAAATGWGATQYRGENADTLQKVILNKFSTPECSEKFGPNRNMKQGFDANTQICYGDRTQSKDTCQGDSGGPLQIKNRRINCMYTIIGVTSFGKACGWVGEPGIYTKVSEYVPWIESIVWP